MENPSIFEKDKAVWTSYEDGLGKALVFNDDDRAAEGDNGAVLGRALINIGTPEAVTTVEKDYQFARECLVGIAYENHYALGRIGPTEEDMRVFKDDFNALTSSSELIPIPQGFVRETLAEDLEKTPSAVHRKNLRLDDFITKVDGLLTEIEPDITLTPFRYSRPHGLSREELVHEYIVRQIQSSDMGSFEMLTTVHERLLRLQRIQQLYAQHADRFGPEVNFEGLLCEAAASPEAEKYIQALIEERATVEALSGDSGEDSLQEAMDGLNSAADLISKYTNYSDIHRNAVAYANRTIDDDMGKQPSFEDMANLLGRVFDGQSRTAVEHVMRLWTSLRNCHAENISGIVNYSWDPKGSQVDSSSSRRKLPRRPLKDFIVNSVRKIALRLEEQSGLTEAQIVAIRRIPVIFEAVGLACWEDIIGEDAPKKPAFPDLDDGDSDGTQDERNDSAASRRTAKSLAG